MIFALLAAAGHSTRMGRPKLALPLGDKTILEKVVRALCQADIEQILVVLGPHIQELAPLAQAAGGQTLVLTEPTSDMRATVEHGLRWLEDRFHPKAEDQMLLVPADHPLLDPKIVRQLRTARQDHPYCSIVIPTYEQRRGHPALIDWRHVAGMRALPAGHGLNVYLRQQANATLELPVNNADVLLDLDTPEDYQEMLRRLSKR